MIAASIANPNLAASVANPNLATLLFYTCVTKEVKNQCNESFTLDQAESANAGFCLLYTSPSPRD